MSSASTSATPDPSRKITVRRPKLYAKQRDAIFAPSRFACIEASTKAGKTVGSMAWLLEQAVTGKPGQNYWWVAPIYPQARIAFRRMQRGLPRSVYTANKAEQTIALANGTVLWFKGADNPDSLYGEDVYAAVIDEASRCRDEVWHAIRSTLTATRGPARLIGNVKGRKNFFYRLCRLAESGTPDFSYAKITAYDAVAGGVLAAEEIEAAKRELPDNVFRELYLAEPSDDGGNPFGLSHIDACLGPLSAERIIVWGVDLAKSYDWTVAVGLDARGIAVAIERWQGPWPETETRLAALIGPTPALIDATGVGDPVVAGLQKRLRQVEGYTFTAPSKQQLMEGLAVAIQNRRVRFPDGVLAQELRDFEYAYTRTGVKYTAPQGLHDDCVCALALAVHKLTHRPGKGAYL